MADAERLRQFVQSDHGGIASPVFETADILLAEAGNIGELFLCQRLQESNAPYIPSNQFAHVHARRIGGRRTLSLSTIVHIKSAWGIEQTGKMWERPWRSAGVPGDGKAASMGTRKTIFVTGTPLKPANANPEIADEVPWSDTVTPYDEAHFVVYLRLLDAAAEGADEDEMSRIVLGIDPARESERARKALKSHLERARWMARSGYRDLMTNPRTSPTMRSKSRSRRGTGGSHRS